MAQAAGPLTDKSLDSAWDESILTVIEVTILYLATFIFGISSQVVKLEE